MDAYPDTLNKRLKEMLRYNLVEPIIYVVDRINRIKHRLTPKGQQHIHKLRKHIELTEKLESEILSSVVNKIVRIYTI